MDTGSFVLRVKEGETLLSLCRKFNLAFEKVIAENRLVREPAAGELLYVSRAFREMHVAEAGETYRSIAEKYGFRTENHDYHCGSVLYGDSEKEVGIIAHLDVVPASADGWSTESPFVLTKRGECIIGRGTRDDKGPALMGLYTMRYFKENGIRLPFTIRLVLGCDEEVGSTDLEYFKKVRSAPWFSFTPDSDFPVCIGEKGKILGSIIEIFLRKHSVVDEDFQVIPLFLKLFTVILEDRLQTV